MNLQGTLPLEASCPGYPGGLGRQRILVGKGWGMLLSMSLEDERCQLTAH